MKVKGNICIKFSKDRLFRRMGNLPEHSAYNWCLRGATNQKKGKYIQWEMTQALDFSSLVCNSQFFPSGVPFGMFSESALRLLSDDLLTFFHSHAKFTAFPHRNLYKPFSEQLLSFISLVGLSRMWANNTEERHFTPSSS